MELAYSCESFVTSYKSILCHIAEDYDKLSLYIKHYRESLRLVPNCLKQSIFHIRYKIISIVLNVDIFSNWCIKRNNKKIREESMAYFTLISTDHIQNDASNNTSLPRERPYRVGM
jgi:hypothetical protein